MNNKFCGVLDLPELEDELHRLEVLEMLLKGDEIAFTLKWAYGAGNAEVWFFDGVAKKDGLNYIAKNVIGKKYLGSTGDDDGNDILFKKVIPDDEFGELELEGTIKYKAQIFNFEGLLELMNKDEKSSQEDSKNYAPLNKDNKIRRKWMRHHRMNNLFFIDSEINDLPMHFRAYVKANRIFLLEIKQYQENFKGLSLAKNFIDWTVECQKTISSFEVQIQQVIDGDLKLFLFFDEKKDMAELLEDVLDMEPRENSFNRDNLTVDQANLINNTDEYFYNLYKKTRENGYRVYNTWIDAESLYVN